MMYRLIPVALLIAGVAAAQVPGAAAKRAAQNAANATNAQLSQQTGQPVPAPKGVAPSAPKPAAAAAQKAATATPNAAQPSASSKAQAQSAPAQNAPASNLATQNAQNTKNTPAQSAQPQNDSAAPAQPNASAATGKPTAPKKDSVLVMRESYEYNRDGRRDPFVSLMTTSDLRPVLSDLRLTGVLYDLSQRRHIAIMRDDNGGAQWRVTTGMTLGRMRVSAIRPKVVVFTIEEFGFSRQDSLILGDSTRVRSK